MKRIKNMMLAVLVAIPIMLFASGSPLSDNPKVTRCKYSEWVFVHFAVSPGLFFVWLAIHYGDKC